MGQNPMQILGGGVSGSVLGANQHFNGDNPGFYVIPDNRQLLVQYLLLYEISGGEELCDLVTQDFSKIAFELRVIMEDVSVIKDIVACIDAFLADSLALIADLLLMPVIFSTLKPFDPQIANESIARKSTGSESFNPAQI